MNIYDFLTVKLTVKQAKNGLEKGKNEENGSKFMIKPSIKIVKEKS